MKSHWRKPLILISLLLLASLPAAANAMSPLKTLEEQVKRAETLMDEGQYNDALTAFRAITEEKDFEDLEPTVKVRVYNRMGNIYMAYNDFDSSAPLFEHALEYAIDDPVWRLRVNANLMVSYNFNGNESGARRVIEELAKIEVPASEKHNQLYYTQLGHGYYEKHFGSPAKSVAWFRSALKTSRLPDMNRRNILNPISELFEYYDNRQMPDSAMPYLLEFSTLAEEFHSTQMISQSQRGLLHNYILTGDTAGARAAYYRYFAIMDSIYAPDKFVSLNTKFHRHRTAQLGEEIQDLELRISRQNMFFVIIGVVAVAFLIFWWSRRKTWAYRKELYRRNREIVTLQQEVEKVEAAVPHPAVDESPVAGAVNDAEETLDETGDTANDEARNLALMGRIRATLKEPAVYCDADFSLQGLSKLLNTNVKYLSQAINAVEGVNFRTYINALRVQEARRMLTAPESYGNLTIQAIGEKVGFKSASNFILAFKKVTGLTPSVYLKMEKQTPATLPAAEDDDRD